MAVQFDSFSSQAQTAVSSPFQQRQDQVRDAARRDDDKEKTKTKPAQTAAAQTQPGESRQGNVIKFSENKDPKGGASETAQRGTLLDLTV